MIVHADQGAFVLDVKSILGATVGVIRRIILDKAKGANKGQQPFIQVKDWYRFAARPVRHDEWDTLPHVHLTSDKEWDSGIVKPKASPNWAEEMNEIWLRSTTRTNRSISLRS